MIAERISAGACREKRGSRAGRNRTTGRGKGAQLSGESEQIGHNRAGHTKGIRSDLVDWRALPEEAREKNISRQPGEQERTAPAHHRKTRHTASSVPKGARHNRRERQRKRRGQPQKGEGRETPFHRRNETGEDRPEGVQGTTWLL